MFGSSPVRLAVSLLAASLSVSVVNAAPQAAAAASATAAGSQSATVAGSVATATTTAGSAALPVVDLDYQLHQALIFNQSGGFYNFSNIRYAAPPLGNLRFAAPVAPAVNRSVVDDGSRGRVCPQAGPLWYLTAAQFVPQYLAGQPINITSGSASTGNSSAAAAALIDPRTTEDCLFLDVVVPKTVYDNRNTSKANVIVWIYGGGYTGGEKSAYSPGLVTASNNTAILVTLNYRLGAFGFLSTRANGTFQKQGGTSNAGLYDQRFALEWVQKYISRFGGDPKSVTVIGESAGGGSIEHQITAYGGANGPVPFQRAIPQSPGWSPIVSNAPQEASYAAFLKLANVTDLAGLRAADTTKLITANLLFVASQPYGQFGFGPTVDDVFVPDLPGRLLAQGKYAKDVKIMTGHNRNEGLLFTNPQSNSDLAFRTAISVALPTASNVTIDYIVNVLYPSNFTGAYGYKDQISRADLFITELIFTCNTFYLQLAQANQSYSYIFDVPPALHGDDIQYTFYNGQGVTARVASTLAAQALQSWIVTFAKSGIPSAPGTIGGVNVPMFPIYGSNARVEVLQKSAVQIQMDDAANARCRWWQNAYYAPLDGSVSGIGNGTLQGPLVAGGSGTTVPQSASSNDAKGLKAPTFLVLVCAIAMALLY